MSAAQALALIKVSISNESQSHWVMRQAFDRYLIVNPFGETRSTERADYAQSLRTYGPVGTTVYDRGAK